MTDGPEAGALRCLLFTCPCWVNDWRRKDWMYTREKQCQGNNKEEIIDLGLQKAASWKISHIPLLLGRVARSYSYIRLIDSALFHNDVWANMRQRRCLDGNYRAELWLHYAGSKSFCRKEAAECFVFFVHDSLLSSTANYTVLPGTWWDDTEDTARYLKSLSRRFQHSQMLLPLKYFSFVSFAIPTSFHTRLRGSEQKEPGVFCLCSAAAARRVTDVELDVGWRKKRAAENRVPGVVLTSCFGGWLITFAEWLML